MIQLSDRARERFHVNYIREGACWRWVGVINRGGYGLLVIKEGKQRNLPAHRVSYELHVGPIPEGLVIDHLCRNRACVNPDHLEPVTIGENVRRGISFNGSETHCKRGHEFTPENTGTQNGSYRYCRTCKRAADARRWRAAS